MKTAWRLLALTTLLAMAVQAIAEQPAAEDPQAVQDQNRRLLDKWRSDPDHYARLKRDEKAFQELSPDRQDRLRKFDFDLHAEDPATQARLWAVLERYVAWLDKLSEDNRKWIEGAPTAKERLARVKYLRDQQWVERLPQKAQDELNALPGDKRAERIAELRQQERVKRLDWFWASHPRDQASLKRARPTRMTEFPPEVRYYWAVALSHVLPDSEKKRLQEAEGNWPLYARTLAKAMESPPPELPGSVEARVWPTQFNQLPEDWRRALLPFRVLPKERVGAAKAKKDDAIRKKQEEWGPIHTKAGRWPDYAVAVTHFVRAKQLKIDSQLGPAKLEHFPPFVQNIIKVDLLPKLTPAEKADLAGKEGKWPEYAELLLEKAKRHQVAIPGLARPEPKEFFEAMSKVLPDVPDGTLRNFALTELTAEERTNINLSPNDEQTRERLLGKYWEKHPDQLASQLRPRGKMKRP
jgi:hypothetical protein